MHSAIRRAGMATMSLSLLLAAACNPDSGGTVTPTVPPTEAPATTTTTEPPTTTTSSTTTTTRPPTTTTTAKKEQTYVDPGGKFRFTHPGWLQGEEQEGFANFVVIDAGVHRFSIKHHEAQLNQSSCRNSKGTVIQVAAAGGKTTPFCRQPSSNGQGTNFIGFPPVGNTAVGVILYTPSTDATEIPPSVKAALQTLAP